MGLFKIKREILAIVMKSPLYFTIPLQGRLQFIKFFSQDAVFNEIFDPQICQEDRKDDDLKKHEEIWFWLSFP
jgi:hypothetical protein